MNQRSIAAPSLDEIIAEALRLGCPKDQLENFARAGLVLHTRQYAASAAARLCDLSKGPTHVGYGGARGGGKSHWLLAQIACDDCQRYPGIKVLLLRKSAKTNREGFEDLRQKVMLNLKYTYNITSGVVLFANGSRILIKHFQHEKELSDSFLGMGYDIIAIEEATTLTESKINNIQTCLRTSKPDWRPRMYSTTNPGGVGHHWYFQKLILPHQNGAETDTRFIPARVHDNKFIDPGYEKYLSTLTGWRKPAWCDGDWNIASGQFFNMFRPRVHVLDHFDDNRGLEWFAAIDYGFTHYTVCLLACRDVDDNIIVVDEFAARLLGPERISRGISSMFLSHKVLPRGMQLPPSSPPSSSNGYRLWPEYYTHRRLSRFVGGGDLFTRQFDGTILASHFSSLGRIRPANTNRVQGWAEIQRLFGDPDAGINPTMFIHARCKHVLNCIPYLQHDPDHPADVLKSDTDEEGLGGDDAADALRYLVATPGREIVQRKLIGF